MDFTLRKLDDLQEILYELEDFLQSHRDNEVLEFLSDNWKECLLGGIVAAVALYHGHSYYIVSHSSRFQVSNFQCIIFVTLSCP